MADRESEKARQFGTQSTAVPGLLPLLESISPTASIIAILMGCLVLLGWALDFETLKRVLPNLNAMNPATAVAFVLSGLSLLLPGELDRTRELVQRTVKEARRVIEDLRPTALDDFGLATAVRQLVEELENEGWQICYEEALGEERLPPQVETVLYRVAQEALTNTRKRADHQGTHRARPPTGKGPPRSRGRGPRVRSLCDIEGRRSGRKSGSL